MAVSFFVIKRIIANIMDDTCSDKRGIKELIDICVAKGMERFVVSPGSRNAPLSISLNRYPGVETLVIVDERSAAFFALGMAQQTGKPVGLVCTSGTALLNYAPAIAEAYYQRIPLVVLSADRPHEWIDQDDGQCIRQWNVFSNFVKASYQVSAEADLKNELWYLNRIVNQALNIATSGKRGPVHVNLPTREPLYGVKSYPDECVRLVQQVNSLSCLDSSQLDDIVRRFNSSQRILILGGMQDYDTDLNRSLSLLAEFKNVVVLSETISNLEDSSFLSCIDRVVSTISDDEAEVFKPDLLISFGGPLISRMVKAYLRSNTPQDHWFVGEGDLHVDTFRCLTSHIKISPSDFFKQLTPLLRERESSFSQIWKARDLLITQKHNDYLKDLGWSDLKAFEILLGAVPNGGNLQLSNSSVVRYAQLFKSQRKLFWNSNRGTSGIDGCTSTAVGAAWVNNKLTTLITGDVSFFYDSNALWNRYLKSNLRIIVINNGGGGIFRFITGPSNVQEMEEYFETAQDMDIKGLVEAYGFTFYCATCEYELQELLHRFYAPHDGAVVLEVKTPRTQNDKILKEYFKYLKV